MGEIPTGVETIDTLSTEPARAMLAGPSRADLKAIAELTKPNLRTYAGPSKLRQNSVEDIGELDFIPARAKISLGGYEEKFSVIKSTKEAYEALAGTSKAGPKDKAPTSALIKALSQPTVITEVGLSITKTDTVGNQKTANVEVITPQSPIKSKNVPEHRKLQKGESKSGKTDLPKLSKAREKLKRQLEPIAGTSRSEPIAVPSMSQELNTADTSAEKPTAPTVEEPQPEPSAKRPRFANPMDDFIYNLQNSTKTLQAVLSDEYLNPIPTTKVYVGQVKKVKDLSQIIKILNEKLPLKQLSHLKRACRKEVILFHVNDINYHCHKSIQYYVEEKVNELRDAFEYFKVTEVPAKAPKLKKQFQEIFRIWGCHFHPDKYLETIYSGQIFNEQETKEHRLFMGMAFEVARYYMSITKPDLQPSDIMNGDVNAAVVIDPAKNSVVAVAFDNREEHPTQHSAMMAIDNVAKTQMGGAWNETSDIFADNLRGIGSMGLLLHLKKKYPNVIFGAKKYFSKKDLDKNNENACEFPYLCTGYYVYLIREPCIMCSMGLVHARTNRVFFSVKNPMGGMCSKTKLQCVSALNHRFEVYTEFL